MHGIATIARKEMYHIQRDPRTLVYVFFFPVMFLVILGTAISGEIYNISWNVWDLDHSKASRELIAKIANTEEFNPPGFLDGYDEIEKIFMSGDSMVALIIPPGFSKEKAAGKTAQIQVLVNGSDPNSAIPVMNYINLILVDYLA